MDYTTLKIGERPRKIGRKIKEIISKEKSHIVYLDENDIICTSKDSKVVLSKEFGHIQNLISSWESICNSLFSKEEAYEIKCLLAEGYGRMFEKNDYSAAKKIIDQTAERIKHQGEQILRQDYLISSLTTTCVIIFILFVTILSKRLIIQYVNPRLYEIFITALFGGVGAFISTMIRARNYQADISTSRHIHRIDGFIRIIYGLIAGVMIAIGIKANILFGFINHIETNMYVLPFLGAIGGASEMLLPNIIKQFDSEKVVTLNKSDK
jgi:hypothetical protein